MPLHEFFFISRYIYIFYSYIIIYTKNDRIDGELSKLENLQSSSRIVNGSSLALTPRILNPSCTKKFS